MGEHSIITPETRVIDRESGSRVVCQFPRDFTAGGIAGGVRRRRSFDHEANSSKDERGGGGGGGGSGGRGGRGGGGGGGGGDSAVHFKGRDSSECENKDSKQRRKWRHSLGTSSRGFVGPFRRLVLLVLSLLGLVRASSTSVSTSRGPLLVSSSCALVSLLVVGLLRPIVAVPTSNVVAADYSGQSDTTTLTRIMLQQHREGGNLVSAEEEEANMEKSIVVEATMNRRRTLGVEDPASDYDDEEDEDDGEDSLLTPLLLNPRESGLERRSRLREAELDTIRRSIVEGLGLERIPDPSKANVSQTEYRRAHQEYLTRLHSRAGKDDRLRRLYTFHAAERSPATLVNRTRRSANSSSETEDRHLPTNIQPGALYFPLEISEDDTLVDHATLRLLVDSSPVDEEETHVISLYRITADSRHFVSRQNFPAGRRGPRWIELDATELASLWHEYGLENLGVELRFERKDAGRITEKGDKPRISDAALNVFTTTISMEDNDGRNSRRKRRASPEHLMSLHKGRRTECRGENKKCCRHQMTVIFKDLEGFEFIVQPKSFDAGYCKGRCPPRYNPAHHHALLQSLIWKEDKRKAPRPCCAPSKLDELEILYFDENDPTKLKVSSWKNMKVLECACS